MALYLEENFDTFKGGGYDGHGNGGEETCSGGLGYCEVGLGACFGGEGPDELLTDIIALGPGSVEAWMGNVRNADPEANSDCERIWSVFEQ